jgi:hypothetical protein
VLFVVVCITLSYITREHHMAWRSRLSACMHCAPVQALGQIPHGEWNLFRAPCCVEEGACDPPKFVVVDTSNLS